MVLAKWNAWFWAKWYSANGTDDLERETRALRTECEMLQQQHRDRTNEANLLGQKLVALEKHIEAIGQAYPDYHLKHLPNESELDFTARVQRELDKVRHQDFYKVFVDLMESELRGVWKRWLVASPDEAEGLRIEARAVQNLLGVLDHETSALTRSQHQKDKMAQAFEDKAAGRQQRMAARDGERRSVAPRGMRH